MYYYDVSYLVLEDGNIYKNGNFGMMHNKKCVNTTIKTVIKRMLPADKKALEIIIKNCEWISEEEAKRRFGINILNVRFKQRLVR